MTLIAPYCKFYPCWLNFSSMFRTGNSLTWSKHVFVFSRFIFKFQCFDASSVKLDWISIDCQLTECYLIAMHWVSLVLKNVWKLSFCLIIKDFRFQERKAQAPVCCSPWRGGCTWTCWRRWRSRARRSPPATDPPSSPPRLLLLMFIRVLLHLTALCQQLLQQIFIWNKEILLRFGTNIIRNYLKQRLWAQSLFLPTPIGESAWGQFFSQNAEPVIIVAVTIFPHSFVSSQIISQKDSRFSSQLKFVLPYRVIEPLMEGMQCRSRYLGGFSAQNLHFLHNQKI